MKNHWIISSKDKRVEYHIEIKKTERRIVGWETTGHWRSETGGQVSFNDFLKGDWDKWITNTFGENVLIEIKETVQSFEI